MSVSRIVSPSPHRRLHVAPAVLVVALTIAVVHGAPALAHAEMHHDGLGFDDFAVVCLAVSAGAVLVGTSVRRPAHIRSALSSVARAEPAYASFAPASTLARAGPSHLTVLRL